MGRTVGHHLDVAVPADAVFGERTDDGPVAGVLVVGISLVGLGQRGRTGREVEPQVIETVGLDHDVRTVLADGERRVEAAEVATIVDGPILVLAELEFVADLQGDALGHVELFVFGHPHFEVAVPADAVFGKRTDHAERAGLGVFLIRAAFREGHHKAAHRNLVLGINVAVEAGVLVRVLHRGADDGFEIHALVFLAAQGDERVAQRRDTGGQDVVLIGRRDDLADGFAVERGDDEHVVDGHLVVEAHIELAGRIGHGQCLGAHFIRAQHRRGGLGGIERGEILFGVAGRGHQGDHACKQNG